MCAMVLRHCGGPARDGRKSALLGLNCIVLLPVYEYDETDCPRMNPFTGEGLCNYQGYSTVSSCVPMQRFSSRDSLGAAIVGFTPLVRELHQQGIEVGAISTGIPWQQ